MGSNARVSPTAGLLLLFPAWLPHRVDASLSPPPLAAQHHAQPARRISVSFNLRLAAASGPDGELEAEATAAAARGREARRVVRGLQEEELRALLRGRGTSAEGTRAQLLARLADTREPP